MRKKGVLSGMGGFCPLAVVGLVPLHFPWDHLYKQTRPVRLLAVVRRSVGVQSVVAVAVAAVEVEDSFVVS